MLVLLLSALSHILNVLLFVQGNLQCATVGIDTLQDLSILHRCLKEGRIQRESHTPFDSLMLDEGIYTALLELDQAVMAKSGA